MQTESKNLSNESLSNKKLNVNAPIFEPNNRKLATKTTDPIWSKFQIPGNSKSTMLVQPQRQYNIPVTNYNFSTYIIPSYQSLKVEYMDQQNGSNAFLPAQPVYIDPNNIPNPPSQVLCESHKMNDFENVVPTDQKETPNAPQTSVAFHSISEHQLQTQQGTQSLNVGINAPHLILPQNNISPYMWQSCSQSQSVALFNPYYPRSNTFYLIPSSPMYTTVNSPYGISQSKSTSKNSIRNKVFHTGDVKSDNLLNDLVKRVNPVEEFVFRSKNSRFFVIKSFTEDNIYQSILHSVWCSTPVGNETLVSAYTQVKSREIPGDETTTPHVYLFFSVNGSGYFCGVAEMTSGLHTDMSCIWNQKKWQSQFSVKWLYIKDVPNSYLRQIKIESNDNRPVTNCRDATEILPMEQAIEVLRIIHNIHYDTCLLNDFTQDTIKMEKS